jgi:hypothetical protein
MKPASDRIEMAVDMDQGYGDISPTAGEQH